MALRLFIDPEAAALAAGATLALPEAAARHAQVRRLQPGDALVLFDGRGHEAAAEVLAMGRRGVTVCVRALAAVERELPWAVTLALGMPGNVRMDALVEKATELGMAALQPLLCERSVLRLDGERAERRRAHWQAVAVAAAEQCGRTRVPEIGAVRGLQDWLAALPAWAAAAPAAALPDASPQAGPIEPGAARWLLSAPRAGLRPARPPWGSSKVAEPHLLESLDPAAMPPAAALARCAAGTPITALSGPEGGLTPAEQEAARAAGFVPVGLGPRVLRADTAPLALLAWLGLAALGPRSG